MGEAVKQEILASVRPDHDVIAAIAERFATAACTRLT